ncbi:MAG: transposase [Bacteroidales bacterium]|nr:transposase [Bacteroidales bacterium]
MRGRISFRPGAVQHVYQNTYNGFLVFYSIRDFLAFFTIFTTTARRYHVRILGLCLMVDHLHVLVEAPNKAELSRFVHDYTWRFSMARNAWYGEEGAFFRSPFGRASKVSDKDIRSAIAYLYNNPVERQMCNRPEQAQWNFLAYAVSGHPFSQPLRLDKASAPMRRAIEEVKVSRKEDTPLNYLRLEQMTRKLRPEEQLQLTDLIVSSYNCIDYDDLIGRFDSYEKLVLALNTTKGSEYSIKEEFVGHSDRIYGRMSNFLLLSRRIATIDDLLRLSEKERRELMEPLALRTGASRKQIEKYLHLPPTIES